MLQMYSGNRNSTKLLQKINYSRSILGEQHSVHVMCHQDKQCIYSLIFIHLDAVVERCLVKSHLHNTHPNHSLHAPKYNCSQGNYIEAPLPACAPC